MTDLVRDLTRVIGERLADDRAARHGDGRLLLDHDAEHALTRSLLADELDDVAAGRLHAGLHPLTAADEESLTNAVLARVLGVGRLQPLLDDPDISDIHIRGCDSVWIKLRDGSRRPGESVADTDDELVDLVRLVATRLGRSERRFDAANPELNLQLPDGSRLFATMAVSSRPSVVIRRHRFELSSLTELAGRRMLTPAVLQFLRAAVLARRNIIVAGGTGTGKTTLLRGLLNEVPSTERIITIEDAYELGLDRFSHLHPDHDMLQARPANIEGQGEISMLDLARMALRMDPDRVVVGEVRGGEAFPMLLAMSQGNNGSMCTMHADSTKSVFPKLAAYVAMADTRLPVETVNLMIATAVHFVVYIHQTRFGRQVASIREVVDADGARIVSNEVFAPGRDGWTVPAYALREATIELLEQHGLDPDVLERERDWSR